MRLWYEGRPITVPGRLLAPLLLNMVAGGMARRGVNDRMARIAVKGMLHLILQEIESEIREAHSTYPVPRLPKGADLLIWGMEYIADYLAAQLEGVELRVVTEQGASGEPVVTGLVAPATVAADPQPGGDTGGASASLGAGASQPAHDAADAALRASGAGELGGALVSLGHDAPGQNHGGESPSPAATPALSNGQYLRARQQGGQ